MNNDRCITCPSCGNDVPYNQYEDVFGINIIKTEQGYYPQPMGCRCIICSTCGNTITVTNNREESSGYEYYNSVQELLDDFIDSNDQYLLKEWQELRYKYKKLRPINVLEHEFMSKFKD